MSWWILYVTSQNSSSAARLCLPKGSLCQYTIAQRGQAVMQLVAALRYKPEGLGFNSRWCQWNFSFTQSFRSHYGPRVDSVSNRNEYKGYSLGLKADGSWGWKSYHLHLLIVCKSGSPKTSGTLKACPGLYRDKSIFTVVWNSVPNIFCTAIIQVSFSTLYSQIC